MRIELPTHKGLIIENFTFTVESVYHVLGSQRITANILFTAPNIRIMHESEPLVLTAGIPSDAELGALVYAYVQSLQVTE